MFSPQAYVITVEIFIANVLLCVPTLPLIVINESAVSNKGDD